MNQLKKYAVGDILVGKDSRLFIITAYSYGMAGCRKCIFNKEKGAFCLSARTKTLNVESCTQQLPYNSSFKVLEGGL